MSDKNPLVIPHVEGLAARQAHADIPTGTFEREIGRDGFSGPATHLYHRNPPTAFTDIQGAVRPRAFNPGVVAKSLDCPWSALPLASNASIHVRYARLAQSMRHLVRNADGDELLFVHAGAGELFCDYGHLSLSAGDYMILPRGTLWRLEVTAPLDLLMIEATGSAYRLPERGMVGRHAPFDPGVLAIPAIDEAFTRQQGPGEWRVRVKRGNAFGTITYSFNPLDAVGWKGDLYPVRLNIRDVRAISSHRLHLPPSVRTSFVADQFIVCSLTPRPVETDAGALKLPFFHNNDDYDELIFYHAGVMSSRGGAIQPGMLTFHPSGFTHGPHPGTLPHMLKHPAAMFEGYSIAIDTREALVIAEMPEGAELADYASSWRKSLEFAPDAAQQKE
jgi:homogentisate 1,2-dioxygenase